MRVSYVRKVQDQSKLTPEEIKVLKTTFARAIVNGHPEVIEELLTRGMPLLSILDNNKTALRIAAETDNPRVYEGLLIESMRTFQLFPYQDVIDAFLWILNKKHYALVDLTLFALEQHPISQERFDYFIKLNKFFDKLVELCDQQNCAPHHIDECQRLLQVRKLDKDELMYFFNFWERKLAGTTPQALSIYTLLADEFDLLEDQQAQDIISEQRQFIFLSSIGLMLLAIGSLFILIQSTKIPFALAILAGSGVVLGICALSLKKRYFKAKQQIAHLEHSKLNRRLLKGCRQNKLDEVQDCIQAGAFINHMGGIAYSTPMHEASRYDYGDLVSFLAQLDAYDGTGSPLEGSLWDYSLHTPKQDLYPLSQLAGKVKAVLLVNIASRCDFTSQLRDLEALYQEFKAQGLEIIAVPSNDFLGKEPLTDEYITEFCQLNYGVTFPIMAKSHVVQAAADPLFNWLGQHTKPKWNFQKYIFNRDGLLVQVFQSHSVPTCNSIRKTLEVLLK